ncbi:MAG: hypothetical protein ABEJ80_06010 [Halarchaeum sp.]
MSATTTDATRVRTMLLARARGRQDALTETWGERPERPARAARTDYAERPVPSDVATFAAQAYPWRIDLVCTDADGRVLLRPDADGWTLPGGEGLRAETVEEAAERHADAVLGGGTLRDVLWTQLVEFDYGAVDLPALRVVAHVADRREATPSASGERSDPGAHVANDVSHVAECNEATERASGDGGAASREQDERDTAEDVSTAQSEWFALDDLPEAFAERAAVVSAL